MITVTSSYHDNSPPSTPRAKIPNPRTERPNQRRNKALQRVLGDRARPRLHAQKPNPRPSRNHQPAPQTFAPFMAVPHAPPDRRNQRARLARDARAERPTPEAISRNASHRRQRVSSPPEPVALESSLSHATHLPIARPCPGALVLGLRLGLGRVGGAVPPGGCVPFAESRYGFALKLKILAGVFFRGWCWFGRASRAVALSAAPRYRFALTGSHGAEFLNARARGLFAGICGGVANLVGLAVSAGGRRCAPTDQRLLTRWGAALGAHRVVL